MTSKTKSYGSDVLASVHEAASGLHDAGLMDKKTMRKFDSMCLTPVAALPPEQIREIREHEQVSQAVFARHLNVTTGLISQWERGEKKPAGASLKLLTLVRTKGLDAIA
ncbi:MAG: DNA-binding transcriptional regulator [Rhodospirillaceae bacterium]